MRKMGSLATTLGLAAMLLALCGPAVAGDYHVAMTGSDATGDGSAARPWRTLTHAIAQMPAATSTSTHRLRLGAGLWLPGGGEVFPVLVPQGVTLLGAGSGITIIAGHAPDGRSPASAPTTVLIRIQPGSSGWSSAIGPTGVEGMTLAHARIGIEIFGSANATPDPGLRDIVFWHDQIGIQVLQAAPTIERCVFDTATMGLAVTRAKAGGPDLVVRDCTFRFNVHGINLSNALQVRVEGNRFEQNGTGALVGTLGTKGIVRPLFRNNVYLKNGFGFTATALAGSQTLPTLAHETFAYNNTGIVSVDNASGGSRSDPIIRNCIVWGSLAVDVSGVDRDEIRNCVLQTANGAINLPKVGQNGILGVDPQFVNAAAGDVHLADTSPAIDRGRSNYLGVPAHDVDGDPRETGFPDLGADEYQGFLHRDVSASTPGRLVLRLAARADVGLVYAAAVSLRAGGAGGIPVGARRLPLHPDSLFFATVGLTSGLPGFLGTLNAQGRATLVVPVPRFPLPASRVVHFAFITLQPTAPSGIQTISNPVPVDLAMP